MTQSASGGCQCGAIRYVIAGDLPPAYACHCDECKKQSGSAFGLSLPIEWSRFEVEGQVAISEGLTYGGKPKLRCFCPNCGNRMWHRSSQDSAWVTLKVGTLNNAAEISPRGHLWVSKKQPWIVIDPALPTFDTQPDNVNEWRQGLT